jgi:glycosyltransferase involved in cell wall biosynthesis
MPDMALRLDSRRFEITLRRLLSENTFDVVQVEGIEMAWVMNSIRIVKPNQKLVYDAHNAETLLQYRALQADLQNPRRWPEAAYSWVQSGRLRQFEAKVVEQADWVTAVSQIDKEYLTDQQAGNQVPITVIPNCIDVVQYNVESFPERPHTFDIIFIGKMDYRPNVDAVLWFADKVWPQILAGKPDTTWAIVGQKPHARLNKLQNVPGIKVTGWVEHVQPYLAGAKVFVMPFRVGSGTRLKLIEALAAGKAVVSTSLGVEGYSIEDGRELLLADTPADMALKVLDLLQESQRRIQLGVMGRIFAKQYDWRKVIPMFDEVYDALAC